MKKPVSKKKLSKVRGAGKAAAGVSRVSNANLVGVNINGQSVKVSSSQAAIFEKMSGPLRAKIDMTSSMSVGAQIESLHAKFGAAKVPSNLKSGAGVSNTIMCDNY